MTVTLKTALSAPRRLGATLLLAGAVALPGTASALPTINGAIALSPSVGTTWGFIGACTSNLDCDGFTLTPSSNNVFVSSTFGSFTGIAIGTVGTMTDVNVTNLPITPQWSAGGFSFDLLTANVLHLVNQSDFKVLQISGSGVAKGSGFANTFGQWYWTAISEGSGASVTFSFAAFSTGDGTEAPPTPVTEPGALVAIGASLLALGFAARRRRPQGA